MYATEKVKRSTLPRLKPAFSTAMTKPVTDPRVTIHTPRDPNTLSNYHNLVTRHTSVDFDIDFDKKRLYGSVTLTLESLTDEEVKDVVLDSRYVASFHSSYRALGNEK